MNKSITIFMLFFTLHGWSQSIDNQVISTAGSFEKRAVGSLSSTVGEPFVHTFSRANAILTQGFQQPLFLITDVSLRVNLDVEIKAYPNPTTDVLNIYCNQKNLEYRVVDLFGKQIMQGALTSETQTISLGQLADGIFLLEIYSNSKPVLKTYKITKN